MDTIQILSFQAIQLKLKLEHLKPLIISEVYFAPEDSLPYSIFQIQIKGLILPKDYDLIRSLGKVLKWEWDGTFINLTLRVYEI